MADAATSTATLLQKNDGGINYPWTKMNFLVTLDGYGTTMAAFNEVTGVEASVDVIEFRQGNAHTLAPAKIPGLVKHGNVTLKMGFILNSNFQDWMAQCVSETRGVIPRKNITIELYDLRQGSPATEYTASQGAEKAYIWTLKNAWVTKYSAPDLNASTSEVAIESIELAYEELDFNNSK